MASKVTFKPPQGVVPEGTQVGDTFDLVSTFRLESNGNVCLTIMGETKMAGYDNAKERKPVYREEAQAMTGTAPEAPDYG
jgi:hypothetical protein